MKFGDIVTFSPDTYPDYGAAKYMIIDPYVVSGKYRKVHCVKLPTGEHYDFKFEDVKPTPAGRYLTTVR